MSRGHRASAGRGRARAEYGRTLDGRTGSTRRIAAWMGASLAVLALAAAALPLDGVRWLS
ncbi:MAG TPA: hypothetical protein VLC71_10045 [Thermomonas sp.]|nr:hypothetical protein [Thermomonas sp.]